MREHHVSFLWNIKTCEVSSQTFQNDWDIVPDNVSPFSSVLKSKNVHLCSQMNESVFQTSPISVLTQQCPICFELWTGEQMSDSQGRTPSTSNEILLFCQWSITIVVSHFRSSVVQKCFWSISQCSNSLSNKIQTVCQKRMSFANFTVHLWSAHQRRRNPLCTWKPSRYSTNIFSATGQTRIGALFSTTEPSK